MSYVDGFVLPVPKKNVKAYKKMAALGGKMWMKHGAVQYFECEGDDMKAEWSLSFPQMVKPKAGETIFFSFIVYKNKAHRDKVNKKVMSDPSMNDAPKKMPFDVKRMAYGGFKAVVEH